MSDTRGSDSDSDVSSNSSWTVLDDTQVADGSVPDGSQEQAASELDTFCISTPELFPDIETLGRGELPQTAQPAEGNAETQDVQDEAHAAEMRGVAEGSQPLHYGCLTLEEYLKERQLEHDFEYDNKQAYFDEMQDAQPKRARCQRKKCKAESLGILVVMGAVLAVAGVSFLCLLAPANYTLTDKEIEKVKTECSTVKVLDALNASTPAFPVVQNSTESKVQVADQEGALGKCFRKNESSPYKAKRYLKRNKKFKSVKTFNLMNDDQCPKVEPQEFQNCSGPFSYEEYLKRQQQCLNSCPTEPKNIRDVFKKAPLLKPKSGKAPQDVEPQKNETAADQKNETAADPKTFADVHRLLQEQHMNMKLQNHSAAGTSAKEVNPADAKQETPEFPPMTSSPAGNQSPDVIKNETVPDATEAEEPKDHPAAATDNSEDQAGATTEKEDACNISRSKIACNIVQDLMLLRMTSKIAKRMAGSSKKEKGTKRKTLRLRKECCSTASLSGSHTEAMPRHFPKPCIRFVDETRRPRKKGEETNNLHEWLEKHSNPKLRAAYLRRSQARESLMSIRPDIKRRREWWLNSDDTKPQPEDVNSKAPTPKAYGGIAAEKSLSLTSLIDSSSSPHVPEQLNNDKEALRRKHTEYLERLSKQQRTHLEYLRKARERQKSTIEALLRDQRKELDRYKDVGCGKYQVPIPSASEVTKRLMELNDRESPSNCCNFNFHTRPTSSLRKNSSSEGKIPDINCCFSNRLNTCSNKCKCGEPRQNLKREEDNQSHRLAIKKFTDYCLSNNSLTHQKQTENGSWMANRRHSCASIPQEYIDMKKKYYDRIGSYWRKREEYLERRIDFMNEVSSCIKEVVEDHRNKQKNELATKSKEEVLNNIINIAVSGFPGDSGIQRLKSEVSLKKTNPGAEKGSDSSSSEPEASTSSTDPQPGTSRESDEPRYEFTANQCQLVTSNNVNIRKDCLYSWLFGKKGQHIRKRDIAYWYYNRISKKKNHKDISKHDSRRGHRNKKNLKDF